MQAEKVVNASLILKFRLNYISYKMIMFQKLNWKLSEMSKSLTKRKVTKLTKTVTFLKPMSCKLEKKSKKPNSVLSLKIQKQKTKNHWSVTEECTLSRKLKTPTRKTMYVSFGEQSKMENLLMSLCH